jgi:hypothetical protein
MSGHDETTLIWVEANRLIPKYALRNMHLTKKLHPHIEQVLITDQDVLRTKSTGRIKSVAPASTYTKEFQNSAKIWKHEQKYFWQGTTLRFFLLFDYMKQAGLERATHLESDTVLLDSNVLPTFFRSDRECLLYPLQSEYLGCASIFAVNGIIALEKFLIHILESWDNSSATDMSLLGTFSRTANVEVLPTWPSAGTESEYIFDAGSVGPFYLGADARNFRIPFSRRGIIDPSKGSIGYELLSSPKAWIIDKLVGGSGITAQTKSGAGKLANIHIHSKRVPRSVRKLESLLRRGFLGSHTVLWNMGHLDFDVCRERIASFVYRRVLRRSLHKDWNFR